MSPKKVKLEVVKDIESLKLQFDKKYGVGIVKHGIEDLVEVERWKLSSPKLNHAFGGGFAKGRMVEVFGPESSGKTSISCAIAGDIQQQGGRVAYIDTEHALDIEYATTFGLDMNKVWFSQPDSGNQALDIAEELVDSGQIDLIIIDSVAALVPQAEIDGEMGDSHMGLQARLMSQACRKLTAKLGKSKCSIIFINQIRMKIGIMFGNPETTTGGKALKFYSSTRLEIRKIEFITEKDENIGYRFRIKTSKNKVGPPMKKYEMSIMFWEGINVFEEYIDYGIKFGFIEKSGSWYSYNGERLGQGKQNVIKLFKENPEQYNKIVDLVTEEICKSKVKEVIEEPIIVERKPKEEVVEIKTK